ncbi:hypothetical protein LTS18_003628 [Coniosporium uncinatum]|uniref:Uncharacterized protein n=1 Tax=Coniosporium uncinatum TaxID=93489 RepID=A0ACC3DBR7_9PEZI|nr:hypothetical protein LTS18_003628 [Coniosporium uncinatum]
MAVCVSCQKPLVVELQDSDSDEDVEMGESSSSAGVSSNTLPDDVHLNACGCHFHWQCLLDAYSLTDCPNCHTSLTNPTASGGQAILCTLHNEGGIQQDLDILPLLTEESYLKAYPEDRKCRAFMEFCREGDVEAIVGMLKDPDPSDIEDEEDGHPQKPTDEVLRYQDPVGDMQSGLHAAVQAGSREVAYLLLLVASELDLQQFPPEVFQEAAALGVMREDQMGKVDIRSLRDANGRSAEDLAREVGGIWTGWPGRGWLVA